MTLNTVLSSWFALITDLFKMSLQLEILFWLENIGFKIRHIKAKAKIILKPATNVIKYLIVANIHATQTITLKHQRLGIFIFFLL